MDKLKPKEKRVLDYINQTIDEQGYPPSVREICSSLGIKSTSTAHMYIERLASKGYIEKLAGKSRAIKKADDALEEGKRYRAGHRAGCGRSSDFSDSKFRGVYYLFDIPLL